MYKDNDNFLVHKNYFNCFSVTETMLKKLFLV